VPTCLLFLVGSQLKKIADQAREDLGDDLTGIPGTGRRQPGRIDEPEPER